MIVLTTQFLYIYFSYVIMVQHFPHFDSQAHFSRPVTFSHRAMQVWIDFSRNEWNHLSKLPFIFILVHSQMLIKRKQIQTFLSKRLHFLLSRGGALAGVPIVCPRGSLSCMFYFFSWFVVPESNDGSLAGLWRTLLCWGAVLVNLLENTN